MFEITKKQTRSFLETDDLLVCKLAAVVDEIHGVQGVTLLTTVGFRDPTLLDPSGDGKITE